MCMGKQPSAPTNPADYSLQDAHLQHKVTRKDEAGNETVLRDKPTKAAPEPITNIANPQMRM
jgi:hypothetical protein